MTYFSLFVFGEVLFASTDGALGRPRSLLLFGEDLLFSAPTAAVGGLNNPAATSGLL